MNKFFNFIEHHAKLILVLIAIITVFFAYHATKLYINASFTSFMPWGEGTDTYKGGISGQKADLGTKKASEKSYTYYYDVEAYEGNSNKKSSITTPKANPDYEDVALVTDLPAAAPQEGSDLPYSSTFLLLVEADDLFTAKKLDLVDYVINLLVNTNELYGLVSPLDFVTMEKSGSRLAIKPISPKEGEFWTEEEAQILKERIDSDPVMKYFLVGGSGNSLYFQFSSTALTKERMDKIDSILDILEENGIRAYVSGGAKITYKVTEYILKDLIVLVTLCLIVVMIVFYLSFRSKRSVLIPTSLSIIGLIWTLGTMSLLGISLNILNIVTPCMVLTLGSAYAIHVLSEYYAQFRNNNKVSAVQSTRGIYNTILFACLTTVCGFLCLTVSETEGLKEFGISVSFGIAYCAILSCFYMPAVLSIVKPPKQRQIKNYSTGFMQRLVSKIAYFVIKYWITILVILAVLICGFALVKNKIPVNSNYMSYFPESDRFGQESKHFAEEMGGGTPYIVTITAPEGEKNFFLKSENLQKVRAYEEAVLACPDVLQSISFTSYVAYANEIMNGEKSIPSNNGLILMINRLIAMMANQVGGQISQIASADGNKLTLYLQHWDAQEKDLMTASSIARSYSVIVDSLPLLPEGTTVTVSGDALPNIKFSNRIISDQNKSTLLSLLIVFVLSLITSKNLKKGVLTIVPVGCGIMINYLFMYFLDIPFDIITISFSSIAIGCGVDDAIHFMLRLRTKEKQYPNASTTELLHEVIIETGRPIILTTVSIVAGMMMLSFASYTPIRYFGLLMSITLFGCMASTLLFIPPCAILIDKIKQRFKKH